MTSPYQWDAHDYERHSEGQLKWALELIAGLELVGEESVIDLGCGSCLNRVSRTKQKAALQ
jgi:trans-aconitate methyltransferase